MLVGNYKGNKGINIANGIISAIVDDDTIKINSKN